MRIRCPQCGGGNDFEPGFSGSEIKCRSCGSSFEAASSALAPCPDCASLISRRAAACPYCGAPFAAPVSGVPQQRTAGVQSSAADFSEEQEIDVLHPSAMHYFWEILLGIVTIPVVIGVFILLYILIEIKCTCYTLTTHRIIVKQGWIAKEQTEIWIRDMRGVNLEQSIWQRIVGIGDVAIGTAASAGTEIHITGIADPAEMVARINSLR